MAYRLRCYLGVATKCTNFSNRLCKSRSAPVRDFPLGFRRSLRWPWQLHAGPQGPVGIRIIPRVDKLKGMNLPLTTTQRLTKKAETAV